MGSILAKNKTNFLFDNFGLHGIEGTWKNLAADEGSPMGRKSFNSGS